MRTSWLWGPSLTILIAGLIVVSCGGDDSASLPPVTGGSAGSDASTDAAGSGGVGKGGTAGTAGKAGSAGTGGQTGQGGTAGQTGQGGTAGQTGQGGTAGQTGQGGTAGQTGQGGAAGQTGQGGTAGQTGQGGTAGEAGTGGIAGSGGDGGASGTSGTGGVAGSGGQVGGSAGTAGVAGLAGSGGVGGNSGAAGFAGVVVDAGPDAQVQCNSNQDCDNKSYCEKKTCNGALPGTCQPRPTTCTNYYVPVCGCDGVNYFNDCLRQQAGIAASSAGECNLGAAQCSSTIACPTPGAVCAFVYANNAQCGAASNKGTCWYLPAQCPGIVVGADLRSCLGPAAPCTSFCQGVKAGGHYFHDSTCPQ